MYQHTVRRLVKLMLVNFVCFYCLLRQFFFCFCQCRLAADMVFPDHQEVFAVIYKHDANFVMIFHACSSQRILHEKFQLLFRRVLSNEPASHGVFTATCFDFFHEFLEQFFAFRQGFALYGETIQCRTLLCGNDLRRPRRENVLSNSNSSAILHTITILLILLVCNELTSKAKIIHNFYEYCQILKSRMCTT